MIARSLVPAALGVLLTLGGGSASAQVELRDLVVTGGLAVEGYQGNLSAVTVPLVDSTDAAAAGVGEFGLRGILEFYESRQRGLRVAFDGGLRQFAAVGFQLRDYAPREWVGNLEVALREELGAWGSLHAIGGVRGRNVDDRPPMPLFLQPGYGTWSGSLVYRSRGFFGIRFTAELLGERSNYRAPDLVPQLDLLDRTTAGTEVGLEYGTSSVVRVFGGYRRHDYPQQGSFDPLDPFRQDQSGVAGLEWTFRGPVTFQLGAEGIINRSNSRRPEYDAVRFRGVVSAPIGDDHSVDLYAVLTAKRYLFETEFARLVPGEEADNASVVYLQLTRALAPNLDGSVRLGWTRAETDLGDSYYERYGA